ncbi:unnamed protein product [Protopolystoma xenopodis]|uniref:FYVE-type domain-containing protein n=1 Tax=Protopolystoma xenopodis TaxID=117903 RepID=A0A3S5BSG1_9PLAT|nr:unnamed protein product [Protopolystoma xenopodis]
MAPKRKYLRSLYILPDGVPNLHHCRHCGKVVCDKCSSYRWLLPYLGSDRVRVCRLCHNELQAEQLHSSRRLRTSDPPSLQYQFQKQPTSTPALAPTTSHSSVIITSVFTSGSQLHHQPSQPSHLCQPEGTTSLYTSATPVDASVMHQKVATSCVAAGVPVNVSYLNVPAQQTQSHTGALSVHFVLNDLYFI